MTTDQIDEEHQSKRTQRQRSAAMRDRLVNAARLALREEGYAHASVSRIVERAGVSRGAYLHHFPSKDLLMQHVGNLLLRDVFRAAGEVALATTRKEDRFGALIWFIWRDVVRGGDGDILLELFQAARTDIELAASLRPLALRSLALFKHAAEHYFAPASADSPPIDEIVYLIQNALRGMLLDAPLVTDERFFERHVEALIATHTVHVVPNDVDDPPTRIPAWEETA